MLKTLWIDVEDLFEYTEHNPRPSGIQRLAVEFYRVFEDRLGSADRVRFVRLNARSKSFVAVPSKAVFDLFENLSSKPSHNKSQPTSDKASGSSDDSSRDTESAVRRQLRRLLFRFPTSVRYKVANIVRLQVAALRALVDLTLHIFRAIGRRIRRVSGPRTGNSSGRPTVDGIGNDEFMTTVKPGDVLLAMGANWACPNYASIIQVNKERHGIDFAFLSYDIIPITCPEWCEPNFSRVFKTWVVSILPISDHIFAISQYSADDLSRFAKRSGISLRRAPHVVTIGSGFKPDTASAPVVLQKALPPAGTYVLYVSTIEARKNQSLLFRVWRRLLADMAPSEVPTLVFAGRLGWQIADLISQIENTNYLDRKIVLLPGLSDFELSELYRGCLFTVYPSLYEGWGLPVTESLAFGKPCVASNKTSIPEAGGRFARYFDPDNGNEAYEVIRALIDDRVGLAEWERDIQKHFRPTSWTTAAETMLAALGMEEPGDMALPSAEPATQAVQ